jgi:hypothetical protein
MPVSAKVALLDRFQDDLTTRPCVSRPWFDLQAVLPVAAFLALENDLGC